MSTEASKKRDTRKNADDAYEAFMSMPDSEWTDMVMSLVNGGVLEVEENKGFERAMKDRGFVKPTTSLITEQAAKTTLLSVTPATVLAVKDKYLKLRINGVNDKVGYTAVHEARMLMVKMRKTCEKEHKVIKEDALRECQRIDQSRRDILAEAAVIEKHLEDEETAYENEKARLAKLKEDEKRDARHDRLVLIGWTPDLVTVTDDYLRSTSEADFETFCSQMVTRVADKKLADEARARQEAEAQAAADRMRLEREALDKQRQAQEAEAARLQAIQDDIIAQQRKAEQAERDRLAAIEREEQRKRDEVAAKEREAARAQQLQKAKEEAAEKARIETEHRIAREAQEKADREQAERDELARQEALKPDKEKLLAVADAVSSIQFPEVSEAMSDKVVKINRVLVAAAREIRDIINAK